MVLQVLPARERELRGLLRLIRNRRDILLCWNHSRGLSSTPKPPELHDLDISPIFLSFRFHWDYFDIIPWQRNRYGYDHAHDWDWEHAWVTTWVLREWLYAVTLPMLQTQCAARITPEAVIAQISSPRETGPCFFTWSSSY
jgi:hypothetical protein